MQPEHLVLRQVLMLLHKMIASPELTKIRAVKT
jgi:hypothetical protein